jgi:membrane-associated phospholipid phosphatase
MRAAVAMVGGILAFLVCLLPLSAHAGDSTEIQIAKEISRPGTLGIVTAAVVVPLVTEPEAGPNRALRTVDAIGTAALVSTALKHLIDEPRLDGTGYDSFPSSHATVAFAAATMAADYQPEQAPYWYGAAALIGWSRVRQNRHRVREVIAGAAIGFGIAKLEQELPRGLILAPLIDPDTGCNGVEVLWEF